MRFAVMGAGAIGGYVGGRLSDAGHDVTLIARGAHLAAILKNGLQIESVKGDLHLPNIAATDDPRDVGEVDCILFLVKNFDVAEAAISIRPMVGRDTIVVTGQNGVSAPAIVEGVIGSRHVIPGVIRFPGDVKEPGVIRHPSELDKVIFGEATGSVSRRTQQIQKIMHDAGITALIPEDILQELWEKMVMQASFASMCALTRLNIDHLRENAASAELFQASMRETETVALKVVPRLIAGMVKRQWEFLESIPNGVHASMLDDLNRGKRIEINALSGEVSRLGRLHDVPTPIHDVFVSSLAPFENGAPNS